MNNIFRILGTAFQMFPSGLGSPGYTIQATAIPAVTRTYTIPDVLANANFVMSEQASMKLVTSGGTAATFNYYEELDTTLDFTGNFAGTQNVAVKYTRVGRCVTLSMASFTVAANATGGINSAAIPTRFRPSINISFIAPVRNNSQPVFGGVTLTSGGVLAFNRYDGTSAFASFQNTGNVGIVDNAFSWHV